jgi:hypothetical protein
VDLGGPGLVPVGYGYRSVEYILRSAIRLEEQTEGMPPDQALRRRREILAEVDQAGVMATPANSRYNELVIEAARLSILNGGREVKIHYGPPSRVELT